MSMTETKIDVDRALAAKWGGRKALNWSVLVGCPETRNKRESICAVNRLSACWAASISGHNFDKITFFPGKLDEPLHRVKSAVILVAWRSEIADAPQEVLDKIFAIIVSCSRHAFFMLTKKPKLLASKLEKYRADFPLENLFIGVTVNLQSELYRVRELEIYLKDFGAYFCFVEPCLGKHEQRAWLEALQDCPSLQWLVLGGWSDLTPDWVREHNPVSSDSMKAILSAVHDLELSEHRYIPVAFKDNSPLTAADGYKSNFPLIPEWLKAYGMFNGEDNAITNPTTAGSQKRGSQANMF